MVDLDSGVDVDGLILRRARVSCGEGLDDTLVLYIRRVISGVLWHYLSLGNHTFLVAVQLFSTKTHNISCPWHQGCMGD